MNPDSVMVVEVNEYYLLMTGLFFFFDSCLIHMIKFDNSQY